MTSTASVVTAWEDNLLNHASLLAYTDNIYTQNILESSEYETNKLRDNNQKINFLIVDISRGTQLEISNCATYNFIVDVVYTYEHDIDGDNQQQIKTVLELIETLVRTQLGKNWASTVDGYDLQSQPAKIVEVIIDGCVCWQGTFSYTAKKFTQF